MMSSNEFKQVRRAVISPDDTCLSAGGGVAIKLLDKAGTQIILNELAKFPTMDRAAVNGPNEFSPIDQSTVVVTSGGRLPIHYILHAAAMKIVETGGKVSYQVSKESVYDSMASALKVVSALEIGALWVPLMGTGVGPLAPRQSFESILKAIADSKRTKAQELTVTVVVYPEGLLDRNVIQKSLRRILGAGANVERIA